MRYSTLSEWLAWQETLHPAKIALGLERVRVVLDRMALAPLPPVVTVAGTNGKGSCVAMLEAMLRAAGHRVGAYTSPHLLRYNERVRLDGQAAGDEQLCAAFARVDAAREDVSLTYFEFGTLAALDLFAREGLDAVILEVGMGGRLDAVNVIDPEVAVITTVDIDHAAWLGGDRESIATEKAGVFRSGRPAIYGDSNIPAAVAAKARALHAPLYRLGLEFGFEAEPEEWSWWGPSGRLRKLPLPRLVGPFQLKNAATALMALAALHGRLPTDERALRQGLPRIELMGRLQALDAQGLRLCDVAHNPQAAAALAEGLRSLPCPGHTHAVLGMLADKDVSGVVAAMKDSVDVWHLAGLDGERGAPVDQLAMRAHAVLDRGPVHEYETVAAALQGAWAAAGSLDRIVVFGSFYTVAAAMAPENAGWRAPPCDEQVLVR